MKYSINELKSEENARKVILFLQSPEGFDVEMTEYRKKAREKAVLTSLGKEKHKYWYAENEQGKVIGAVGICENERENGGYFLDYFAVHKDYRRLGLGSELLQVGEDYVKKMKGRYITIDTGNTDAFKAARAFYERNGYTKVGVIPEYYDVGEDRVDYYKRMN